MKNSKNKCHPGFFSYLMYVFISLILSSGFAKEPDQSLENNLNKSKTNKTVVSISGEAFYINGEITYKGQVWEGRQIEGLLLNSRMVQGIFDDLNPATKDRFKYPDTDRWDPDRNTNEFVAAMKDWHDHGLLAFTLNLQGGSPLGYGNLGWINSTFDEKGNLRPAYINRLERILNKADELGMVVILGYFYFGQDQHLANEAAVINAVDNITNWVINKGYRNILIEINNECNIKYDHEILQAHRVHELIERVQNISREKVPLLVGTSYGGGFIPLPNVVTVSDFILIHGNGVHKPSGITRMVEQARNVEGYTPKPILFNEDDHYNFTADNSNLVAAIDMYASWGYFDYRRKGEGFEAGFQSVPVDWRIGSDRKISFFNKIAQITGKKGCSSKEESEQPNIVFIFADDLGYGDLSCFGADDIFTPNIDKMAEQGIKFKEFYSASPVCSPSRAGLLTGRMPQRMGINGVFFPESFTGMAPEEITIAEKLKEVGYKTGIIGKWHLGHMPQFLPLNQGFDEYYGIPYSNDMESVVYLKGNEVDSFDVNQTYITRTYTKRALDFVRRNKDTPFFLYIAHNMPHVPIYASPQFLGTSRRGLYGDVIQELDWSVGEILKELEKHKLLENTIIVFSSDNGPWLVMEDHGGSAGILRGGKMFTFEGGVRVPTVAMWKKKIKPGTVYNDLATQMDWFPTFLNIAGARVPTDRPIDGVDITNVLLGKGVRNGNTFLYYNGADPRCFREGAWKAKKPYPGNRKQRWISAVAAHDTLMFNLKDDPGERNNLAQKDSRKLRELFVKMEKAIVGMGKLPPSLFIKSDADNSHYEYLDKKHKSEGDL